MLPQLLETFSKIDFNLFKVKSDISFIKKFVNRKILFIGYNEIMDFDVMPEITIDKISKVVLDYDLFVIHERVCYLSIGKIKNLLNYFKDKKKDVIFSGYTTIINANIDNSINMFRPIDITKYPFKIETHQVLKLKWNIYFLTIYFICLSLLIFGSIVSSKILYKIMLGFICIFGIFLPINKIIYIQNNTRSNLN